MDRLKHLDMPLLDFKRIEVGEDGTVRVTYLGRDRATLLPHLLKSVSESPYHWQTMNEEERLSWVIHCIECAMRHELAEYFYRAGLGPDPHRSESN